MWKSILLPPHAPHLPLCCSPVPFVFVSFFPHRLSLKCVPVTSTIAYFYFYFCLSISIFDVFPARVCVFHIFLPQLSSLHLCPFPFESCALSPVLRFSITHLQSQFCTHFAPQFENHSFCRNFHLK